MTQDEEIWAAFRRDSDRLEQLRKAHPDWNIWNVPRVQGHTTWHAQRSRYPLHAHTGDGLEEYITEDERGRQGRTHGAGRAILSFLSRVPGRSQAAAMLAISATAVLAPPHPLTDEELPTAFPIARGTCQVNTWRGGLLCYTVAHGDWRPRFA